MNDALVQAVQGLETKALSAISGLKQNQEDLAQRLIALEQRPRGADPVNAAEAGGATKAVRPRWINFETGQEVRTYLHGEKMAVDVPRDGIGAELEREGFTIGHYARAMLRGAKSEIEKKALSIGTPSLGGHLVPTPLAAGFIDRARAASTVLAAGARTVNMEASTLRIARMIADPTIEWLAENAPQTPTDPTFDVVTLQARTVRALVVGSREMVDDAPNFPQLFSDAIEAAFAAEMDRVCLVGTGTGAQPRGLFNTAGIGTVSLGTNGATIANYDPFVDAITTLQGQNIAGPTAFIYAPRTNGQLAKLKATDNQPLVAPRIVSDVPHLVTSAIPVNQTQGTSTDCSTVLAGDFRMAMIGIRQQVTLELNTQPNVANYQYTMLVHGRMDVAFVRPTDFVRIVGLRP